MKVTRLDHVNIRTHRFEESLRFYGGALGLAPGPVPAVLQAPAGEPPRAAWLYDASGIPVVHLIRGPSEEAAPGPAHLDHVAFACEDREAFAARLEAQGIAFERVDYPQYGIFQLIVQDPNGIRIELGFRPPAGVPGPAEPSR